VPRRGGGLGDRARCRDRSRSRRLGRLRTGRLCGRGAAICRRLGRRLLQSAGRRFGPAAFARRSASPSVCGSPPGVIRICAGGLQARGASPILGYPTQRAAPEEVRLRRCLPIDLP
jgi:hypothetical protein